MNEKMPITKHDSFFLTTLYASCIIFIDQLIKYKIRSNGGFYICNEGISFSFAVPPFIFWLILAIFLSAMITYLLRSSNISPRSLLAVGLLSGGAISNATDRFLFKCVIDYIPTFSFFPVFNIADAAIFFSSCLIILSLLQKRESNGA